MSGEWMPPVEAVEAAARRQWRDDHGSIHHADSDRTPRTDEEDRDRAYADWDGGRVGRAVMDGYRRRASNVLTAAAAHMLAAGWIEGWRDGASGRNMRNPYRTTGAAR